MLNLTHSGFEARAGIVLLLGMAAMASRAAEGDVLVNELMYHPPLDREDLQYVELFNRGESAVNLAKWSFTKGQGSRERSELEPWTLRTGGRLSVDTLSSSCKLIISKGAKGCKVQYSGNFKAAMVRKMTGPNAISANTLAREMGVSQSVLSRWLRLASDQGVSAPKQSSLGSINMTQAKRPKDWTPEEKLRVVVEAESLSDEELGAFLRKNGLHEAHLKEWRQQILSALGLRSARKASKSSCEQSRSGNWKRS